MHNWGHDLYGSQRLLGFTGPQIVAVTDLHHSDPFMVFVPFGGF